MTKLKFLLLLPAASLFTSCVVYPSQDYPVYGNRSYGYPSYDCGPRYQFDLSYGYPSYPSYRHHNRGYHRR